jgi:hypothetical protein
VGTGRGGEMKKTLQIEVEFESWFDKDREPKTNKEWAEFFSNNLMPEGSILGVDDGEYQDMVALSSFNIECTDVS